MLYSLNMLIWIILCKMFCVLIILSILLLILRKQYSKMRANRTHSETVVAFFHPYCNSGGGGERVLWAAVSAIQNKYNHLK